MIGPHAAFLGFRREVPAFPLCVATIEKGFACVLLSGCEACVPVRPSPKVCLVYCSLAVKAALFQAVKLACLCVPHLKCVR